MARRLTEGSEPEADARDHTFALRVLAVFVVLAVLVAAARTTTTHRTDLTVAGSPDVVQTQLPGRLVGSFTREAGIKGQVMVGPLASLVAALNRGDVDAIISPRDPQLDQLVTVGRLLPFAGLGSTVGGKSIYGVYTVAAGAFPTANANRAASFRSFATGPQGKAATELTGTAGGG